MAHQEVEAEERGLRVPKEFLWGSRGGEGQLRAQCLSQHLQPKV